MDCADYRRWFSPYVDARLAPQDRTQLEEHLAGCVGCRSDLASLQQMLQSLRAMESPEVPELLSGIHAKLMPEPWWRLAMRRFAAPWPASLPWHGAALATTALLVIIVGLPWYSQEKARSSLQEDPGSALISMRTPFTLVGSMSLAKKEAKAHPQPPALQEAARREVGNRRAFQVTNDTRDLLEEGTTQGQSFGAGKSNGQKDTDTAAHERITSNLVAEDARRKDGELSSSEEAGSTTHATPAHQMASYNRDVRDAFVERDVAARQKWKELGTPSDPIQEQPVTPPALSTSAAASLEDDADAREKVFERAHHRNMEQERTMKRLAVLREHPVARVEDFSRSDKAKIAAPASAVAELLQVRWRVQDLGQAAAQVIEWVSVKQGFAVATNEHHLSIRLPAPAVSEFLQQFSSDPISVPPLEPSLWVTISLELIPSE